METPSWLGKHTWICRIWDCQGGWPDTYFFPFPYELPDNLPFTQSLRSSAPLTKIQDHKRTWAPSKSTSTFYINLNSLILWVLSTLLESFSSLFFSGQIWIWETVCFFSVSTLFSVQWKVALEILPCGLILTKTSITHHQVTPVPDLGSEHIHGVSQVIPRRVLQTPSAMQETQETRVQSLGWEDPLEEEMATHSSIPAGKIPWTKKPGRLWSMGSQWVRPTEATEHACIHAHVVKLQKAKQIRKNPNFCSSTRTHSKTLSQPWHLTEAQFSLL